jgi:hypothetical protein
MANALAMEVSNTAPKQIVIKHARAQVVIANPVECTWTAVN